MTFAGDANVEYVGRVESTWNGLTQEFTHSFVMTEKPMTVNVAVRSHHRVVSKETSQVRAVFAELAAGYDPMAYCDIVVDHVVGTRRKVDVAACAFATKAAIDGIVDAGVLADDSPEYVRTVTFNAPSYQPGVDALVVTMKGPGR